MLEVGWFSTKLLLKGKLLRNPLYFYQQTAIGVAVAVVLLLGIAKIQGDLWLAIILSSLATGILMPTLLKDIRMK
ncbi:MAG: hypothetical protein ACM37W_03300 [Actinomycetota bacterium]